MRNNDAKSVTQPYSELFDYQLWQKIPANVARGEYQAKVTLGSRFRSAYIRARDNKTINAVIAPCAALARKVTGKKLIHATLPEPILREWRKISKIETGIYPSPAQIRGLSYYDSRMKLYLSELYRKLCLQVKARPDYIFSLMSLDGAGRFRESCPKLSQLSPKPSILTGKLPSSPRSCREYLARQNPI